MSDTLKRQYEETLRENARLTARVRELEKALVDHNDTLRSAFQAAQRDGILEVMGTTNYNLLADNISKVLTKHHAITNEARAALSPAQDAEKGEG